MVVSEIKMDITNKIKKWYKGVYVPPPKNDPNSPLAIISTGYYEKPFLGKIIDPLITFWLKRWPVLIVVIVMTVGLGVQLFIHFDAIDHKKSTATQNQPKVNHIKTPR